MKLRRTPDHRFKNLPDFAYLPRYVMVGEVRIHYVDEGPAAAEPVLMLHGEPTWCFLYRRMIPVLASEGYRVVAPDLVGFGRSDKPAWRCDHTYRRHVKWLTGFLTRLDLQNITLVCQDWGAFIGLRVAAEHPERFSRMVVSNGFLPTGHETLPPAFSLWHTLARFSPWLPVSLIMRAGCTAALSWRVIRAYQAPFPKNEYKAGIYALPRLVPTSPADPATAANRAAWKRLSRWEKPFLTAFGEHDPFFKGLDKILQHKIPGAKNQPHTLIRGAGHFIQEDRGEELAARVLQFMRDNR